MLKKFMALFLIGLMLCTVTAYAETIDFASMTTDELVNLITQARNELAKRIGVDDNAIIGRGTYYEGTMIAAGTYRFTCLETETFYGSVDNQFTIKDSKKRERVYESNIPINGVVTFTIVEGDELTITGCSGRITRIENPVWLPDISATASPTARPTQNVSDTATGEKQVSSATGTKQASVLSIGGVTPEFKKTMDEYEACIDSYIEFMESFDAYNATTTQLAKYAEMMTRCSEATEALDQIDESTLIEADYLYYTNVMMRINQKLASLGTA